MEENIVYQGMDEDITFEVLDDSGVALDISGAAKIYLFLYYRGAITPVYKFSMTAAVGYALITSTTPDLVLGKIKIALLSFMTNALDTGKLYAEIGIRFADVNRTDDTLYDRIIKDIYAVTIKKSLTKTTALP